MPYEANWASLNARPVPQWFPDAKLGIFIHWGLYSVPAFAPFGDYAEWYGYTLNLTDPNERQKEYQAFHKKYYGEHFRYEDFVKDFRAEYFDADLWAKLFRESGAQYINLVSKHHDGFCMYKTDYAWNWNSVDVGPHRDFCAELREACDRQHIRFGVYHSVYEWYHPTYLKNPEEYALTHLIPMLKELVTRYEPSTLFTDGEWSHPSEVWHSTEFLQWLYNDSPVRDYIVPNDRWGSETRGKLGGNFTTEYGMVAPGITVSDVNRPCEECRGIGSSFGWNRFERPEHYLSEEGLIRSFVDLVSAGSNLLLNVGPTPDGRIPVIMQERLLQLGNWLKVNGEGIYASRRYTLEKHGDLNDANAVRYTQKGDNLYVWLFRPPYGDVLTDIPWDSAFSAAFMGAPAISVSVREANGKVLLSVAPYDPAQLPCHAVYGIKLTKS